MRVQIIEVRITEDALYIYSACSISHRPVCKTVCYNDIIIGNKPCFPQRSAYRIKDINFCSGLILLNLFLNKYSTHSDHTVVRLLYFLVCVKKLKTSWKNTGANLLSSFKIVSHLNSFNSCN